MIEIREDNDILYIYLSKFNRFIIDLIRAVPGKKYHIKDKLWEIPNSQTESFLQQLKLNNIEFTFVNEFRSSKDQKSLQACQIFKYEDCAHIKLNEINIQLIEIIKAIPGRKYLGKSKLWSIPISQLDRYLDHLSQANYHFCIIDSRPAVVSFLTELQNIISNIGCNGSGNKIDLFGMNQ